MRVLVVDGANVVGSRPDGWWRDRAGAARRLHARLSETDLLYDEVVLVLEGRGKGGAAEGRSGRALTVHAARSGDDAVLDVVKDYRALEHPSKVDVVTADRELCVRVEAAGARCMSPSWLLDRL